MLLYIWGLWHLQFYTQLLRAIGSLNEMTERTNRGIFNDFVLVWFIAQDFLIYLSTLSPLNVGMPVILQ